MPAIGSDRPIEPNRLSRPEASSSPTPRPIADAPSPIASASSRTARRTCRRLAPTIRSRPSSRVRWAIAIESALKIVNAPTSSATPAKASRIVRRMSTNDFRPSRSKRSSAAAERTTVPAGAWSSSPATRMRSYAARLAEQRLRRREVEHGEGRRADRLDVGERGDADDVELARLAAGGDRDAVADGVVVLLGAALVDDDLARRGGPAALAEAERGQRLGARRAGVEARAEVRPVAERLAVAAHDLRRVGDVADGDVDAGRPHGPRPARRPAASASARTSPSRARTRSWRRRRRRCRRRRRSTASRRRRAWRW